MKSIIYFIIILFVSFFLFNSCTPEQGKRNWTVTDGEYLDANDFSVLVFHDFYPSGHQGGIEFIHHGERIASNGFLRLKRGSGTRLDPPRRADRIIDKENKEIRATVNYEDKNFSYTIRIRPEGEGIRLTVDLAQPIPAEWEGRLNFAIDFFPVLFYGKSWEIGDSFGSFAKDPNGIRVKNENGSLDALPLGTGKSLSLAGEDPLRHITINALTGDLTLVDYRNNGQAGWIMVESTIPAGVTEGAVEWSVMPDIVPRWKRDPMIAISQVGYHPDQVKQAIIELESDAERLTQARLMKITEKNSLEEVYTEIPEKWGKFLRYDYAIFDFTSVKDPGMYVVTYENISTNPFSISSKIYKSGVWQPTLEGYFPVQMCHMKVREFSFIWHGACHLDDALQAPLDSIHVDGYRQYAKAETNYRPMTTVPYLNRGGWHDAGDDDLAAGSQAATTHFLVLADELTDEQPDQTTVDFENLAVKMREPDGISDFVQQIKQGAINLLSGYRASGHSFVGIIANREGRNITGDWASQTDQLYYDSQMDENKKTMTHSGVCDDRWVFTNRDTGLEYKVAAALAASSRSLKGYDDALASECLETAVKAWDYEQSHEPVIQRNAYVPRNQKAEEIVATAELLYTTGDDKFRDHLISLLPDIRENMGQAGWAVARVADWLNNDDFMSGFVQSLKVYKVKLDSTLAANPFGVPWRPAIWGIGWNIQEYALEHYYLIKKYPNMFDRELLLRVVNYVLGCHPGSNTSLVSGVGAHSVTSGFGVYRPQWYYIPGGMVSGTALIRPDFPELKEGFPFLWQQVEYVMPGAGSYIFCVLAAEDLLQK